MTQIYNALAQKPLKNKMWKVYKNEYLWQSNRIKYC